MSGLPTDRLDDAPAPFTWGWALSSFLDQCWPALYAAPMTETEMRLAVAELVIIALAHALDPEQKAAALRFLDGSAGLAVGDDQDVVRAARSVLTDAMAASSPPCNDTLRIAESLAGRVEE